METQKFYTLAEVSQHLQVHTDTLRRWIRAGKVQATKIGLKYRVPASEFQKIMQNGVGIDANQEEK